MATEIRGPILTVGSRERLRLHGHYVLATYMYWPLKYTTLLTQANITDGVQIEYILLWVQPLTRANTQYWPSYFSGHLRGLTY